MDNTQRGPIKPERILPEGSAPDGNLPVKLYLPDVTLICVDTAFPELALRAIRHCMGQVRFGAAVLITRPDSGLTSLPPGLSLLTRDDIHSVADYSRVVLRELLPHVHTSHCLVVQWDGFITDVSAWNPAFLEFDYIGAVLPGYPAGYRVGNGGFSLRSRRLLQALQDPDICEFQPEDLRIARTYRDLLQHRHGIRFADEASARRFSLEREAAPTAPPPSFGLHGLHALYYFLPPAWFRQFSAGIPARLFAGTGTRQLATDAIARGDGQLALRVLRERCKRRSLLSGLNLWIPAAWAWAREVRRKA